MNAHPDSSPGKRRDLSVSTRMGKGRSQECGESRTSSGMRAGPGGDILKCYFASLNDPLAGKE